MTTNPCETRADTQPIQMSADQSPASWPAQSCRERLDGLVYSVTFLFVRSDGLRLPDA